MYISKKTSTGIYLIPDATAYFNKRVLFIEGEITAEKALDFQKQLALLTVISTEAPVLLVISSPGGSIQAGLSIYGAIKSAPFKVDSFVPTQASSMGAILSTCVTGKRYLGEFGQLFLHEPLVQGLKDGSLTELKEATDSLEKCKEKVVAIMCERTGTSREDIAEALSKDHYFDYEEAFERGFVDAVGGIELFNQYEI